MLNNNHSRSLIRSLSCLSNSLIRLFVSGLLVWKVISCEPHSVVSVVQIHAPYHEYKTWRFSSPFFFRRFYPPICHPGHYDKRFSRCASSSKFPTDIHDPLRHIVYGSFHVFLSTIFMPLSRRKELIEPGQTSSLNPFYSSPTFALLSSHVHFSVVVVVDAAETIFFCHRCLVLRTGDRVL